MTVQVVEVEVQRSWRGLERKMVGVESRVEQGRGMVGLVGLGVEVRSAWEGGNGDMNLIMGLETTIYPC